jgi:hypothetical protein
MTKSYLLFIALVFFLYPSAFSQKADSGIILNFSEISKLNRSSVPISQVWHRGMENGIMYAYIPPYYEGKVAFAPSAKYRKSYFQAMTSDLQIVDQKEVLLNNEEVFNESLWFSNTLQMFSSEKNQDTGNMVLTVNSMDRTHLTINEDKKEIIRIPAHKNMQNVFFRYLTSPDSTLLLISWQVISKEQSILSKGIAVFDVHFRQIWSDPSLKLNLGNGAYLFNDCKIDNRGNVYLQADVYKSAEELNQVFDLRYGYGLNLNGKRRYVKQSPDYTSHLISISENGKKQTTHSLSFPAGKLRYLSCEPGNNSLICAGLYSKPGNTSITGVNYFEINPSSSAVLNAREYDFETDFVLKGKQGQEADKLKELVNNGKEFENGLYNLQMRFRNDGGFWLLAEHYEVRMEKLPGPTDIWMTCFYYKDIMVFNFNDKGEKIWKDKIDKLAFTTLDNTMYGSFSAQVVNEDLFVFYNQIKRKRPGMWSYKNAALYASRFNETGLKSSGIIASTKEHKVVFQPLNIGLFSSDQLFFFGQETLKSRLLSVKVVD